MIDINEKLYDSYREVIIESITLKDSVKHFNTLFAVDGFGADVYGCILIYLVGKYRSRAFNKQPDHPI